jgi:hypothetical protein
VQSVALINDRKIAGFDDSLVQLYAEAFVNPSKSDPGCRLKSSIAECLDFSDYAEPELFLRGVSHIQL